jgi:hypothetical protein
MGDKGNKEEIAARIKPILDKVSVEGLKAWLKAIEFQVPVLSRTTVTDFVAGLIAQGQLAEDALEIALIGFEEASDMRMYSLQLDEADIKQAKNSLVARLKSLGIPITDKMRFSGDRIAPMSPVYAVVEGNLLRVKWAEQHIMVKLNSTRTGLDEKPVTRRAVLIANFREHTAELRLNPAESRHAHTEISGRMTAEAYYNAYLQKANDVLGTKTELLDLREVIKFLVEKEDPRIVRIQIDDHTNQKNYKTKTTGPKLDVRDNPDWMLAYKKSGHTWAWDAQSFYWLPKPSSGFLKREVYTHINAEENYVKVNADCSNDEVEYIVSQIRAR